MRRIRTSFMTTVVIWGVLWAGLLPAHAVPTTLSQTATQNVTSFNSVSCNSGTLHTDNSYFRVFDLTAEGLQTLDITALTIGVEVASSPTPTQPAAVRLFSTTNDTPGIDGLTLLLDSPIAVSNQNLTLLDVPLNAPVTVPDYTNLVVELFTPDGQADGNSFFIGSNSDGQTAPAYLMAPDCGVTTPTPTGDLGFPNMHMIIEASGDGTPRPALAVTVEQGAAQRDPTTELPVVFDVVFTEPVTGFDAADIDFTGSTVPGTLTATVNGSGSSYEVLVDGATGTGLITVSVPADAATAPGGELTPASTSVDNTVRIGTPSVTKPTAVDDAYETTGGVVLDVPADGVLANDLANGLGDLTADLEDGPANGTVELDPSGAFTYTPDDDFTGTDTFTYTVLASARRSNVATVTIEVGAAQSGVDVLTVESGDDNVDRSIAWSQLDPTGSSFAQVGGEQPTLSTANQGSTRSVSALGASQTVLIGRDDLFADSLASGGAQGLLDAPLLLTGGDALDGRVADELERLGADTVILLGGNAALSDQVATDLSDLGYTVERLGGASRIDTAVEIARDVAPTADRAVLVRGYPAGEADATQAFADSLAAGALAADLGVPLLLTASDALSAATAGYLSDAGVTDVLLVGGTAAVDEQVVTDLCEIGITVERLDGDTRYDTAVAIAAERGASTAADADETILVDGADPDAWADAFPAALRASQGLAPVVLGQGDTLPAPTLDYLTGGGTPLVCGTTTTIAACGAAEAALNE